METKIAIQGIRGSYHHEVAARLFGTNIALDECLSFDALVAAVRSGLLYSVPFLERFERFPLRNLVHRFFRVERFVECR